MSNPFDQIASQVFEVTSNLMGFDATWTPKVGGPMMTARVLFREPTAKEKLAMTQYDQEKQLMEYCEPDFPNLFESVEAGSKESVMVDNKPYYVLDVTKCWDGRTFKARLEPMRDELQSY